MSEHICINGKKYLPSNIVAGTFGYTSDYVGKLAREEKVLGLLIGRQWFVEPVSLEVFTHKTTFEKQIAKDELSVERKKERITHRHITPAKDSSHAFGYSHSLSALAQAVAVLCCGVFIGSLGMVMGTSAQVPKVVVQSSEKVFASVTHLVAPYYQSKTFTVDTDSFVAASSKSSRERTEFQGGGVALNEANVYAVLPVFARNDFEVEVSQESTAVLPEVREQNLDFSDEVRLTVNTNGETIIEPVFKKASVPSQRFILLPTTDSQN